MGVEVEYVDGDHIKLKYDACEVNLKDGEVYRGDATVTYNNTVTLCLDMDGSYVTFVGIKKKEKDVMLLESKEFGKMFLTGDGGYTHDLEKGTKIIDAVFDGTWVYKGENYEVDVIFREGRFLKTNRVEKPKEEETVDNGMEEDYDERHHAGKKRLDHAINVCGGEYPLAHNFLGILGIQQLGFTIGSIYSKHDKHFEVTYKRISEADARYRDPETRLLRVLMEKIPQLVSNFALRSKGFHFTMVVVKKDFYSFAYDNKKLEDVLKDIDQFLVMAYQNAGSEIAPSLYEIGEKHMGRLLLGMGEGTVKEKTLSVIKYNACSVYCDVGVSEANNDESFEAEARIIDGKDVVLDLKSRDSTARILFKGEIVEDRLILVNDDGNNFGKMELTGDYNEEDGSFEGTWYYENVPYKVYISLDEGAKI